MENQKENKETPNWYLSEASREKRRTKFEILQDEEEEKRRKEAEETRVGGTE